MLHDIIRYKRNSLQGIDVSRQITAIERLLPKMAPVMSMMENLKAGDNVSIIAEVKRKSPSRGKLASRLSVGKLITGYESAGARGISVLTDRKFFAGGNSDLITAKHCSSLPVLRKDFIVHEYQVWESRLIGADAILLIAAVLEPGELADLYSLASRLGMEILVEVHSEREIDSVGAVEPEMIGINNRDLSNFTVDLSTTEKLRKYIPDHVLCVSESGISTREDMVRLQECGVDAALIGEALVVAADPAAKIRELRGDVDDPH